MPMPIDRDKIKQAIRLFLEGIGEDPDREGLKETPDRIARMWEEFEGQRSFDFKLFEEFGSYNEMVLVKDITIYSLCEHHLLPFFGKAHVAYIPDGIICGLSKLVRTVRAFALRPQVQERLTNQIADFLNEQLKPKGVAVVLEMEHLCMSMRGVMSPGHLTITSALRGLFLSDLRTREEFLKLIGKSGR